MGRAATAALIGRIAGRAIHFLGQVLAARILGPAGFGTYAVAWVVIRILAVPAALGLDVGVVKFGGAEREDPVRVNQIISSSTLIGLAWSGLLGATLFLVADPVSRAMTGDASYGLGLRIAGVTLPALVVLRILAASLRIDGGTAAAVAVEDVLRPTLFLALLPAISLAALPESGTAVAFVGISYWIAAAAALVWSVRTRGRTSVLPPSRPRKTELQPLIRYAVPVSAASLTALLALQVDQFLIAAMLESAEVGVYAAAVQLASVFPVVLSALDLALGPRVAAAYAKDDRRSTGRAYRILAAAGVLILGPLFATLVAVPGEALSTLYGESFAVGNDVVVVLALGFVVNASAGGVALVLFMTGHHHDWLKISVVGAVLNAVFTILGTQWIGLVGAALATALSMSMQNLFGLWALKKRTGITVWSPNYWRSVSVVAAGTAIALIAAYLGRPHLAPPLLLAVVVAVTGLAVSGLGWAFALDEEQRSAVRRLLGRVSGGTGDHA